MARKKTAREKLEADHASHGHVCKVPAKMLRMLGGLSPGSTLVVPKPTDVDTLMRSVPKGRVTTMGLVRQSLAKHYGADIACALTTGIFARLAAEAAEEDRALGKSRITPYWRTIRDDGKLNPKFPGGIDAQAAALRAEGFEFTKGRTPASIKVARFEDKLHAPKW